MPCAARAHFPVRRAFRVATGVTDAGVLDARHALVSELKAPKASACDIMAERQIFMLQGAGPGKGSVSACMLRACVATDENGHD